jgi:hypothetical protein
LAAPQGPLPISEPCIERTRRTSRLAMPVRLSGSSSNTSHPLASVIVIVSLTTGFLPSCAPHGCAVALAYRRRSVRPRKYRSQRRASIQHGTAEDHRRRHADYRWPLAPAMRSTSPLTGSCPRGRVSGSNREDVDCRPSLDPRRLAARSTRAISRLPQRERTGRGTMLDQCAGPRRAGRTMRWSPASR